MKVVKKSKISCFATERRGVCFRAGQNYLLIVRIRMGILLLSLELMLGYLLLWYISWKRAYRALVGATGSNILIGITHI